MLEFPPNRLLSSLYQAISDKTPYRAPVVPARAAYSINFVSEFLTQLIHPYAVKATWHGPTQIPRFFKKLNVGMIETSFANDAGQVVNEIKLDELRINPTHYFITDPDSMEDEMGSAAEAKFRGLTFYFSPTP
jgi:hypothetical protein